METSLKNSFASTSKRSASPGKSLLGRNEGTYPIQGLPNFSEHRQGEVLRTPSTRRLGA
jgi:hypothetical protein